MIDIRIPCALAVALAVAACTESGAYESESRQAETAGTGTEAEPEEELIEPTQVRQSIEQALDSADSDITVENAEAELRELEQQIADDDG